MTDQGPSQSVINMLAGMHPGGGHRVACWPPELSPGDMRRRSETPSEWIGRIIDLISKTRGGNYFALNSLRIDDEDPLLFFGYIDYANGTSPHSFSLNYLCLADANPIINGDYKAATEGMKWLRFDYDPRMARGNPFDHPHVHLHIDGNESPRLPFTHMANDCFLADITEFVLLNFSYDRGWKSWAKSIWNNEVRTHSDPEKIEYDHLEKLYQLDAHKFSVEHVSNHVVFLKSAMRRSKKSMFSCPRDWLWEKDIDLHCP